MDNSKLPPIHKNCSWGGLQDGPLPCIAEALGPSYFPPSYTSSIIRGDGIEADYTMNRGLPRSVLSPHLDRQPMQTASPPQEHTPASSSHALGIRSTVMTDHSASSTHCNAQAASLALFADQYGDVPDFEFQDHGWFQPESSRYCEVLLQTISNRTLDEIYEIFFYRTPSRPVYGSDEPRRPVKPTREVLLPEDIKPENTRIREKNHAIKERKRRDLHREYQSSSHARCADLCLEIAERELEGLGQSASKVPGKSDQLLSSLYQQELGGMLIQMLNYARVIAETRYDRLLHLHNHCSPVGQEPDEYNGSFYRCKSEAHSPHIPEGIKTPDPHYDGLEESSPPKRRRRSRSDHCPLQQHRDFSQRLPLSPSASPKHSSYSGSQ